MAKKIIDKLAKMKDKISKPRQPHDEAAESSSVPTNVTSKYEAAFSEWSQRIGNAKTQMRNWRLFAGLSLLIIILLLIVLTMSIKSHERYVYVAQIEPGQTVAHLRPVDESYMPSQAQRMAFVGQFVTNIMTLPLDPVVARNQWYSAYAAVKGQAARQLTDFARANDPLAGVGATTKSVRIDTIQQVSNHSYELSWTQTQYKPDGNIENINKYRGSFTVVTGEAPRNIERMIRNPLGLKIVYFNITKEE